MTNQRDWAIHYLEQGFNVVPASGLKKHPLIAWRDYINRKVTKEEIDEWWIKWPDADIAIITGKISGIFVLDIDGKQKNNHDDLVTSLGLSSYIDLTPVATTGSGKGYHFYFEWEEAVKDMSKVGIIPSVDIRSDGGIVIAPPSKGAVIPYTWVTMPGECGGVRKAPPALIELIAKQTSKTEKRAISELVSAPVMSGERNSSATSVCGDLVARYSPEKWESSVWPLLKSWNTTNNVPPLEEQELRTVFESIAKKEYRRRQSELQSFVQKEEKIDEKGGTIEVSFPAPVPESSSTQKVKPEPGSVLPERIAIFRVVEPEYGRRGELNALVEVTLGEAPAFPDPVCYKLNLLSLSQCSSFSRMLGNSFAKDVRWDQLILRTVSAVQKVLSSRKRGAWASEIMPDPLKNKFLFEPFLVEGAPNIIFGMGSSGKTFLATALALSLASGEELLGVKPCASGLKTLWVDYEDTQYTFLERLQAMCNATEFSSLKIKDQAEALRNIKHWPALGTPLKECIPAVLDEIKQNDFGLIIIDSAVPATGGEPEKADAVRELFAALSKFNTTSLLIAHETKAENSKYPYGSIFMHNLARNIWNVQKEQDEDSNKLDIRIVHTKSNHSRLYLPIPVTLFFGNNEQGNAEYIDIRRGNPAMIEKGLSVKRRIFNVINNSENGASLQEICDQLPDIEKSAIKSRLSEMRAGNRISNTGGFWRII